MNTSNKRRWLKRSVLGFVLLLGVAPILWSDEGMRPWADRVFLNATPRPPFDAQKAAGISAQRRSELKGQFFGGMYMWNTSDQRFQNRVERLERERLWQAMADEGYEMAYLALRVYEPGAVHVPKPLPALDRLGELARQGDVEAICLMARIINYPPARVNIEVPPQYIFENAWLLKGVRLGHPQCIGDILKATDRK